MDIAANANIRVARAAFFPDLTLTGSGGFGSVALSTLFGPGSFFASAAAAATQPVFDNGQIGGQYELNKARYDELVGSSEVPAVRPGIVRLPRPGMSCCSLPSMPEGRV